MRVSFQKITFFALSGTVLLLFFCVVAFLSPQKAKSVSGHTIDSNDWCGQTLTDNSQLYEVTIDLNCNGDGLVIGSDSIIIEGNGHTITGNSGSYGINATGGYDNIKIQNFTNITKFGFGIFLKNSSGSLIKNSTFNSNLYYGIYLNLSGPNNSVIDNTANSNLGGIYLNSSSNNTLTGNTTNSNTGKSTAYGIYLKSSSNNTLSGNTANSNSSISFSTAISTAYGINLESSPNNNLINNIANSNSNYGIYLKSSANSTLTGNNISGNIYNLYITVSDYAQYNNTIDTTNRVENKPVYYLYNQTNQTYDGNVVGNIGMFWCISCTNVTVRNATLSANNYYSVYFINTTGSTIQNIVASNSTYGIYLNSSSNNTLIGNTANSNTAYGAFSAYGIILDAFSNNNTLTGNTANSNLNAGIYISISSSNTLTGNTANSNGDYGIYLSSASSNILNSNIIRNNVNDIYDNGTNTYANNQLLYNLESKMLSFTETTRTKILNDTVSFGFSMFDVKHNACLAPTCNYTETITSPSESLTISQTSGNNYTGHFTVTRAGTYSLLFIITDSNGNITKRNYLFFVNATGSKTITYYLNPVYPTHGQPYGSDKKSLLLQAPTDTVSWTCTDWVQESIDNMPNYPLSNISSIDTNTWYKQEIDSGGYMGVQRYLTSDMVVDQSKPIPRSDNYSWINRSFTNLNWAMDTPQNWYRTTVKLVGTPFGDPFWMTFPEGQTNKSHADFTYSYTTTPVVKSIPNDNIQVLSATAPSSDTNNAQIVLEGTGSTNVVLGDDSHHFSRPFLGHQTTINSDGTTTITADNLSGQTTINSVKMDITPNSGTINVGIDTWNTSGDYYKKWTEVGDGVTSAGHTIGDLKANTIYSVYVDGVMFNNYPSNQNGEISFTYNKEYSSKTFEILYNEITVFITNDKEIVSSSDEVTYTLTVTNNSPNTLTNLQVADPIPRSTSYVTGSASGGGTYDSDRDRVIWNLSSIPPLGQVGSVTTYTFRVTVN